MDPQTELDFIARKHDETCKYTEITDLQDLTLHDTNFDIWCMVWKVEDIPGGSAPMWRVQVLDEAVDVDKNFGVYIHGRQGERDFAHFSAGTVLKILYMEVHTISGTVLGRAKVMDVVVLRGEVGDPIEPFCSKDRYRWSREDEKMVVKYRNFYREAFGETTIEKVVGAGMYNVTCVVTKIILLDDELVLRMADGTRANLDFATEDTSPTLEKPSQWKESKFYVDVYVRQRDLVDRIKEIRLTKCSFVKLRGLRCRPCGEGNAQFELVWEGTCAKKAVIQVLAEGDAHVMGIRAKMAMETRRNSDSVDDSLVLIPSGTPLRTPPPMRATKEVQEMMTCHKGERFIHHRRLAEDDSRENGIENNASKMGFVKKKMYSSKDVGIKLTENNNNVVDLTEILDSLNIGENTAAENQTKPRRSRRKTRRELDQEQMERVRAQLRKDKDGTGLRIEVFPDKGRGVVTSRGREKGEFVVELVGDLIDMESADQRENDYGMDVSKGSFVLYFKHQGRQYCIDATAETGKKGRLLNHSRKHPNLVTKVMEVDGIPRVYMVAKDDIRAGTELVFDYGDRDKEAIKEHPWLAL